MSAPVSASRTAIVTLPAAAGAGLGGSNDDVQAFDETQRQPVRRENLAHELDGLAGLRRGANRQRLRQHGGAVRERHAGGAQLVDDRGDRAADVDGRQILAERDACDARRDEHGSEPPAHGSETTIVSSRIS